MSNQPFTPGSSTSISATNSSSSASLNANNNIVLLQNDGGVTVFFKFGLGSATATTSDTPLLANAIATFSKGVNDTIAAITASGTTTLRITNGEGM